MKMTIPDGSKLLRIYPELARFEDTAKRTEAWRTAYKTVRWLTLVLSSLMCGILMPLLEWYLRMSIEALLPFVYIPSFVYAGMAGGLAGAGIVRAFQLLFHKRIQRSLREQLIACCTPICLECGYDLRGQVEARCPECGAPFDKALLKPGGDPTLAAPRAAAHTEEA